ncbi:hypothetical protein BpHYR1_019325 [Brachionus plicatilis]|uniref:Uncharacterized protein n=1 Tax=Brachionus plicatilis TaxID=10195 RepID=A0A3M7PP66_BRAPC|nr:hypothetical protein BpHYR1_019325 [Brachionus plicatilis]
MNSFLVFEPLNVEKSLKNLNPSKVSGPDKWFLYSYENLLRTQFCPFKKKKTRKKLKSIFN